MHPKSIFLLTDVVSTSGYCCLKLIFEKKILNLQILCNFSSICHCTHPINPCKVSFESNGFREFFHHRNNDHINILC